MRNGFFPIIIGKLHLRIVFLVFAEAVTKNFAGGGVRGMGANWLSVKSFFAIFSVLRNRFAQFL